MKKDTLKHSLVYTDWDNIYAINLYACTHDKQKIRHYLFLPVITTDISLTRPGAQKWIGDNVTVGWAEFSTLS